MDRLAQIEGERDRREQDDGVCPVGGCRCVLGWAQHEDAAMGDPGGSTPLCSKELRPHFISMKGVMNHCQFSGCVPLCVFVRLHVCLSFFFFPPPLCYLPGAVLEPCIVELQAADSLNAGYSL